MKYSDGGIWILDVFILTLAELTSLDALDNKLENGSEHLLEIDGRLQRSPSQTWIGMVILNLPEDTRLDIDSSFK